MKIVRPPTPYLTIAELAAIQQRAIDKASPRGGTPTSNEMLLAAYELLGQARLDAIVAMMQEDEDAAAQRIPRMGPRQLEFEHE